MLFKHIIARKPGKSFIKGITTANEGLPDYPLALRQHEAYITVLKKCGVAATVLEAEEQFPDSCFVEDTAIVKDKMAIITLPGAKSRQGEEALMKKGLKNFFETIEEIKSPGTVDGGDVMMVDNHFYIGISARTNEAGAKQLMNLLKKYGYTSSAIKVAEGLHLKSGMAYLENNNLLITKQFSHLPDFKKFNLLIVDEKENYSANCIWVNDSVVVPAGYEATKEKIELAGYKTETVDASEFRKLDGGLSCLSLRF